MVRTAGACLLHGCLLLLARASRSQSRGPAAACRLRGAQSELNSFLWTIKRDPPSYFFGTIHVPYTRVWDFIPENSKKAFQQSHIVYFELDLTDPYTISALTSCQLLPQGENLQDVLPRDIYRRLKRHLEYVKLMMPSWMTPDQRGKGLYADYLFNAIAGNWERKRPVWVMLMVNSLTEVDIKSRGVPVLDLYLAQEAERLRKQTGAVEKVEEQCHPLNGLNFSQVIFALNQTLLQQESLRAGSLQIPYTTEDLIKHYNCGDLNSIIFNHDTSQVPNFINATLPPHERITAQEIDDYFRQELIYKRNERMGKRVKDLLEEYPDKSFFFAFGAGHFMGNNTVIDVLRREGYEVEHTAAGQPINKSSRHTCTPRRKKRRFCLTCCCLRALTCWRKETGNTRRRRRSNRRSSISASLMTSGSALRKVPLTHLHGFASLMGILQWNPSHEDTGDPATSKQMPAELMCLSSLCTSFY
ncbi:metalloprotease TIKI1 isoform X2 [Alligator mississippiensis]|uniref:metalloprotease TIKI1 isoform X2 n=1 Tax=Alligator mississippiensis TaxID=8496 RepID=UPI002877B064|nr:metalloprotease TIKI1 isoform X2 [Alligator mississippiensis]